MKAAAEGKAEMAFWPVAVIAFLHANSGQVVTLVLMFIFGVSGALSYIFLRNIEAAVDEGKSISETMDRVSRTKNQPWTLEWCRSAMDIFFTLTPDNRYSTAFVFVGVATNIFGGLVIFSKLTIRLVGGGSPNVAEIGLFLLPLLYAFVILSVFIWQT